MYTWVPNLLMDMNRRTVYSYNSFTAPDLMCRKKPYCPPHANRLLGNKNKAKDDLQCWETQSLIPVGNLFQTGLHHAVNKALSLQDCVYASSLGKFGQQISCNLEFVTSLPSLILFFPLCSSTYIAYYVSSFLQEITQIPPVFFRGNISWFLFTLPAFFLSWCILELIIYT